MMKHYSTRYWAEYGKRTMHLLVPVLFFCSTLFTQAATNWVSGFAYGTDYPALASAGSIASIASTNGSLIIGNASTTNLTLAHNISGFVAITNQATGFTVNASGATLSSTEGTKASFMSLNITNLSVTNGLFIGASGVDNSGGGPPTPLPDSAGGWVSNSTASIVGSEFEGINGTQGLIVDRSELTVSNVIVRGGNNGTGLYAINNSIVTIHSGSFTGGMNNTAFWLQDSDTTIYDGTFAGPTNLIGSGLFSVLADATTNHVSLQGGTFSSLAFYGGDGSVQHVLAGTNLVVQNGIVQNAGTVIIDNHNNTALAQLSIFDGTTVLSNDFTLVADGNLGLYRSRLEGLGALEFSSGSSLEIEVPAGNLPVIEADTATFRTNSSLVVNATEGGITAGINNIDIVETTSGIFVETSSGITNATTANFNSNVNLTVTTDWLSTLNEAFIDGNALRLQLTTATWGEAWEAEGQLGDLADELQFLDDGTMAAIISSLGKEASKTVTETTYFTVGNTFQTALHGIQAAVGQSASRAAEFRDQLKLKPSGARGPQKKNDLRAWVKYYGQRLSHDADGLNPEYETDLDGTVIGIDRSLGNLLVGAGGGYGRYSTISGIDGEDNIEAYHGALYGTYGIEKAYIDAGVAYGFNQVETRTTSPFVLNGEFDAQILSAYLGGGIDLVDSTEGMIFTPEASIQYSMYEQDAYAETSDTAVPRNVDAFEADSLLGSIGLNVSIQETMKMDTFSFKYDLRFHWMREFNPDPGTVGFSLEGGDNPYQLALPMLDEDVYRAGVGIAFFNTLRTQPKNVLFRIDFDELFGDGFNSHNFSVKVIYAF